MSNLSSLLRAFGYAIPLFHSINRYIFLSVTVSGVFSSRRPHDVHLLLIVLNRSCVVSLLNSAYSAPSVQVSHWLWENHYLLLLIFLGISWMNCWLLSMFEEFFGRMPYHELFPFRFQHDYEEIRPFTLLCRGKLEKKPFDNDIKKIFNAKCQKVIFIIINFAWKYLNLHSFTILSKNCVSSHEKHEMLRWVQIQIQEDYRDD